MIEGTEEIREIYRNYLTEELARPEVFQARKKLADSFSVKPALIFEPAACAAMCLLAAAFFFFYQIQPLPRAVVRPETRPVMLRLHPTPVVDAFNPDTPVVVKKVSSRTGSTLVYQQKHHDIPITVIWVFPGGRAE